MRGALFGRLAVAGLTTHYDVRPRGLVRGQSLATRGIPDTETFSSLHVVVMLGKMETEVTGSVGLFTRLQCHEHTEWPAHIHPCRPMKNLVCCVLLCCLN